MQGSQSAGEQPSQASQPHVGSDPAWADEEFHDAEEEQLWEPEEEVLSAGEAEAFEAALAAAAAEQQAALQSQLESMGLTEQQREQVASLMQRLLAEEELGEDDGEYSDDVEDEQHAAGPAEDVAGYDHPDDVPLFKSKVAWYLHNRHRPVFPGSQLSIQQAAYMAMSIKREHAMRDAAFEGMCGMIAHCLLPKGNVFPPTLYLMKRILGAREAAEYERHVCVKECYSWPPLPRAAWPAHAADTCPKCGEQRFQQATGSNGAQEIGEHASHALKPRKVSAVEQHDSQVTCSEATAGAAARLTRTHIAAALRSSVSSSGRGSPCSGSGCNSGCSSNRSRSSSSRVRGRVVCCAIGGVYQSANLQRLLLGTSLSITACCKSRLAAGTQLAILMCACRPCQPMQVFWHVPLKETIADLHSDPDFCDARAKEGAATAASLQGGAAAGTWHASEELQRLNRAAGGALQDASNATCEAGFDSAQVYTFLQHSTGFMFFR